ncbi:MAG: FCD domain-containing protein [Janthinobacterium lividum]
MLTLCDARKADKVDEFSKPAKAPRGGRIKRRRLYEDVVERLETLINDGVYAPGSELPSERVLMKEFGTGRPAIREALFALQKMGLLLLSPGERPRVQEPDGAVVLESMRGAVGRLMGQPGGLRQFQRARVFFEAGIVREISAHSTERDLEGLRAALEANRASLGNPRRFEETDVAFHLCLARMAHNPLFIVIHDAMFEWLYSQRTVTLGFPGQTEFAFVAHERIADAVLARSPDRAEAAMREHLEHGHKLYWTIMQQAGMAESGSQGREAVDLAMSSGITRPAEPSRS